MGYFDQWMMTYSVYFGQKALDKSDTILYTNQEGALLKTNLV